LLIDFHMHAFPQRIALPALESLSQKADGLPYHTQGTPQSTLEQMDVWGVDLGCIMNIATNPRQQAKVNAFAVETDQNPRFCAFGSVHPDSPEWEKALEEIAEGGLKGIKLHPEYQEFRVWEPRMLPLYRKCRDLGLIVMFHAGKDIGFPDTFNAPAEDFASLAQALPDLKAILAHFGGWDCWEEVKERLAGKVPFYFDTSFSGGRLSPCLAEELIQIHSADRILFGSDCPWQPSDVALAFLKELSLTEEEMEKICWKNGAALLKL